MFGRSGAKLQVAAKVADHRVARPSPAAGRDTCDTVCCVDAAFWLAAVKQGPIHFQLAG